MRRSDDHLPWLLDAPQQSLRVTAMQHAAP
jgi:hypothetical protein